MPWLGIKNLRKQIMIDRMKSNLTSETSVQLSGTELDERISFYQIGELHEELDYLKCRLALVPEPVQWLCKHLQQLLWTTSSVLGLGWLHDGSRQVAQNIASTPTIRLPTMLPAEMPNPRLFLDVTITYKSKLNTGVQRVVRELCQHGEIGGELAPVIIDKGKFVSIPDLAPLDYRHGDKILLLDSGWTHTKNYIPALEDAKRSGAEIVLGIYDLIPVQHPGFVQPYFTKIFDDWLRTITPYCTEILAISRYSAESFITWAKKNSRYSQMPPVGWFYLGANLSEQPLEAAGSDKSKNFPSNFWLSVGTLEPRKGYSVALDAFELLWLEEPDVSYVIIGRQGDLSSHISDRVLKHPQYGKKLFWERNVNDRLLNEYYKKSRGVIIPALAEGFGLPLIEAHFHGKQIIASDLPVFREVAPEGVNFFRLSEAEDLAGVIRNIEDSASVKSPERYLDWRTATERMISIIKNNAYQIRQDSV